MGAPVAIAELVERYEALFLDAYGVLVDVAGARPGARALLSELERQGKPWCVLTNGASRLPEAASRRWGALGLDIPAERVVTSGSLLAGHFATQGLAGQRCAVLGPADSARYVEQAGGVVVRPGEACAVLVVADETGFAFPHDIDAILTALFARLERGEPVHLVLPNPDLVYPTAPGALGLTAGAIAAMIEAALSARLAGRAPRFVALGKPHPAMFEEGVRRVGTRKAVMIGDQLDTDIRGALACGIDAALLAGGVSVEHSAHDGLRPTWRLASLL